MTYTKSGLAVLSLSCTFLLSCGAVTEQDLLGVWDIHSYHILIQENGKTKEENKVLQPGEQTYTFLNDSTCYYSYMDILGDTIARDRYRYLIEQGALSTWPLLSLKDGTDSLDLDMEQVYDVHLIDDTLYVQYNYSNQMDYNFKSGFKLVRKQYENNK